MFRVSSQVDALVTKEARVSVDSHKTIVIANTDQLAVLRVVYTVDETAILLVLGEDTLDRPAELAGVSGILGVFKSRGASLLFSS